MTVDPYLIATKWNVSTLICTKTNTSASFCISNLKEYLLISYLEMDIAVELSYHSKEGQHIIDLTQICKL